MDLVFLDLETTGLYPNKDQILEIAAVRVDAQLNPVSGFHSLVRPANELMPQSIDPFVIEMHTKNGLWAELQALPDSNFSIACAAFREWLGDVPQASITLAGDSVHFDLGFLKTWMPHVSEAFSHRLLDVSAFRVAREFCGLPACEIVGSQTHRAKDDVMCSIAKARWHLSRTGV